MSIDTSRPDMGKRDSASVFLSEEEREILPARPDQKSRLPSGRQKVLKAWIMVLRAGGRFRKNVAEIKSRYNWVSIPGVSTLPV
jgi:hypothetical protein